MKASKLLSLIFFLYITIGFTQVPANNDCVNAELVIVTTTAPLSISADFTEATESLDASCNTIATDNKDLWYQFTMPIDGNLFINGTSSLNYFALYNTCGGAEIACSQDDASFGNLISGNDYLLRASYQFNGVSTFTIQAFVAAANDECINRETILISTSNFTQPNPDSSSATESLSASCDVPNNTYLDMWYEFVMPVNGNLEVTFANNKQSFALYDSCAGTELQCFSNIGLFLNLNQNSTYILRVAERSTDVGIMNFRLQAFEFALNDECSNSQTILVETGSSNEYQADMRTATESTDATCETANNTNYDLWYNFTMPVTGNLKIDQLSGLDTATVYDSCDGVEISCQSGLQFISGLTENTNYILRIGSVTLANKTPRFRAFPASVNDDCENSETIAVVTSNTLLYQVDVRGATETLDSSCDNPSDNNLDVWYDFVMPVSGNVQISGVSFTFRTTLYDACSGNELDCFNGNGTYFNLGFNTNYKLRVSQQTNTANNVGFNIQAFENLFNDDCATPQNINIPIDVFETYSTNNAAATNSALTSCEPSSEAVTVQDVWYSFTMPSDDDVEIDHLTSSILGYYALYDSCGATELQCFTNDGFFNDLIGGNEYLLKVGNLSSQSGAFSFSISARSETLSNEDVTIGSIGVYPNPVHNQLTISNHFGVTIKVVSIYDVSGRIVKKIDVNNTLIPIKIDVSHLQSGMYLLEVQSEKGQIIKRIIKA